MSLVVSKKVSMCCFLILTMGYLLVYRPGVLFSTLKWCDLQYWCIYIGGLSSAAYFLSHYWCDFSVFFCFIDMLDGLKEVLQNSFLSRTSMLTS